MYLRLHVQPQVQRWGLLFGDFVHNLRSSLDHVVYALAVQATQQDPPPKHRALQFPLLIEPDDWTKNQWHLAGLTAPMRTEIERVQPYKTGGVANARDALLWILSELDNTDKHREVYPVVLQPGMTRLAWTTFDDAVLHLSANIVVPLEDEATVATFRSESEAEVHDNQEIALVIAIPIPGGTNEPIELHQFGDSLCGLVAAVVESFDTFF